MPANHVSARRGIHDAAGHDAEGLRRLGATGTSSSRSTCSRPASPSTSATVAVWEEDFEIEPFVEGGATVFRRLHTPGYEGWTVSRYRQTSGRTPEGDPELHPRGHGPRRRRRAGDAPEPVAVRALLRRPRAVDRARPRLQRLRHRAVHAVLRPHLAPPRPIPLTDIDDAVAEIERVAAAGFRAVLLPATPPRPYYSRDFDPVWAAVQANGHAACSSTPRPAA